MKRLSDLDFKGARILFEQVLHMDPNNGKVYNARVTVVDGGKKLEMRGSILFFGRTQTWLRVK